MPIGTALASAIGQTASSGAGMLGGYFASRYAYKKDLEQWHRQNKYNSPGEQMKRLKSAGLNPNLVYGEGAKGATGNASASPSYQKQDTTSLNNLPTILGVLGQYQNIATNHAQETNIKADTQGKIISNAISAIDKEIAQFTKDYRKAQEGPNKSDIQQRLIELQKERRRLVIEQTKAASTINKYMDYTQMSGIMGKVLPLLQILLQKR